MQIRSLIACAAACLIGSAGCQSNPQSSRGGPPPEDQAVPASARTPDGDRLDRPIPYGHWPYTIDRGGGSGAPR